MSTVTPRTTTTTLETSLATARRHGDRRRGGRKRSPGGSLRIWRDYLVRSTILGFDLHDKDIGLGRRVRFVQGDQSSPDDLSTAIDALGGELDVVIDDGSHQADDILASFGVLFPVLRPRGLYVIEDLHTSYWPQFGGAIPAPDASAVGLVKQLVDEVQALDETYDRRPQWGPRPDGRDVGSNSLHVYPGIVFIEKASAAVAARSSAP